MSIIDELRSIPWSSLGLDYAILFGSALWKQSPRDVDLAVKFCREPDLDDVGKLLEMLELALGVSSDRIDLVILNWDVANCALLREIHCRGLVLYCRDRKVLVDDAVRKLLMCWDLDLLKRKLNLLETALAALRRRWGS